MSISTMVNMERLLPGSGSPGQVPQVRIPRSGSSGQDPQVRFFRSGQWAFPCRVLLVGIQVTLCCVNLPSEAVGSFQEDLKLLFIHYSIFRICLEVVIIFIN